MFAIHRQNRLKIQDSFSSHLTESVHDPFVLHKEGIKRGIERSWNVQLATELILVEIQKLNYCYRFDLLRRLPWGSYDNPREQPAAYGCHAT